MTARERKPFAVPDIHVPVSPLSREEIAKRQKLLAEKEASLRAQQADITKEQALLREEEKTLLHAERVIDSALVLEHAKLLLHFAKYHSYRSCSDTDPCNADGVDDREPCGRCALLVLTTTPDDVKWRLDEFSFYMTVKHDPIR